MIFTGSEGEIIDEGLRLTLALLYYTGGFIIFGFSILAITGSDRPERQDVNATIRANRTRRRRKLNQSYTYWGIYGAAKSALPKRD